MNKAIILYPNGLSEEIEYNDDIYPLYVIQQDDDPIDDIIVELYGRSSQNEDVKNIVDVFNSKSVLEDK